MKTRAGLVWQGLDEIRVESLALRQLHARWAARTGVSPDPQVGASVRQIVLLLNGVRQRWAVIAGKPNAAPSDNEAA